MEQKVLSPRFVNQECTAEVANIIGIETLSLFCILSVSIMWPAPERIASSESVFILSNASAKESSFTSLKKVQSIVVTSFPNISTIFKNFALPTNGLSSTRISVWLPS